MQLQHFEPVFGLGPGGLAALQKQCFAGVIHQVVQVVVCAEGLVGQLGALVGERVGAQWRSVDDELVPGNELRRQVIVREAPAHGVARHGPVRDAQVVERHHHGFGRAAVAQHQGAAAGPGREKTPQRFPKTHHVGVVAQQGAIGPPLNHVYGPHTAGRGGQLVEVNGYAFLVRHGHVQAHQLGVGRQQGRQLPDAGQLK